MIDDKKETVRIWWYMVKIHLGSALCLVRLSVFFFCCSME